MAKRTCKYPDCSAPHKAYGWCRKHHERVKKWGSPDGRPPEPDLPGEQWRSIPGSADLYAVSDMGRVRSYAARGRPGQILKAAIGSHGYPSVHVRVDGKFAPLPVHALIAAAFFGPRPPGMEVRHLDGDRLNCLLPNLTYGTHAENMQDAIRHGTAKSCKPYCKRGHELTSENTRLYVRPAGTTERICLTCQHLRLQAWHVAHPTGPHNGLKTHCPKGHEYTPENTYLNPKGSRECRTCIRERRQRKAA